MFLSTACAELVGGLEDMSTSQMFLWEAGLCGNGGCLLACFFETSYTNSMIYVDARRDKRGWQRS